jgi:hypothetical protein
VKYSEKKGPAFKGAYFVCGTEGDKTWKTTGKYKQKNSAAFSRQANYTGCSTAAGRRISVPTLRIES